MQIRDFHYPPELALMQHQLKGPEWSGVLVGLPSHAAGDSSFSDDVKTGGEAACEILDKVKYSDVAFASWCSTWPSGSVVLENRPDERAVKLFVVCLEIALRIWGLGPILGQSFIWHGMEWKVTRERSVHQGKHLELGDTHELLQYIHWRHSDREYYSCFPLSCYSDRDPTWRTDWSHSACERPRPRTPTA